MSINRRLSVAPMIDCTDRHARYLFRLITKHTLLYTEMITTGAIIHGDRDRYLQFHETEHPVALQLGGSNAKDLAQCAQIGQDYGYDEINLNVGCPSDRVQSGQFGLCLMKTPEVVCKAVEAMKAVCDVPVTVKTRIGVDDQDSYEALHALIKDLINSGCDHVMIHARKGWLKGLSPKQNRTVPPLNYDRVYQIKSDFPDFDLGINGGIETLEAALKHLEIVDAVMMGRAAYHNPYVLAEADQLIFGANSIIKSRQEIVLAYLKYIEAELEKGIKLHHMARHLIGLYHGQPNGKVWRREITQPGLTFEGLSHLAQQY